jgi:hypothetical protein
MSPADSVVVCEGLLRLRLLDEDQGIRHVSCEGEASMPDFREDDDPLVRLLGPGVYGGKVLLGMDRVQFFDTSAVTWLVVSHDHFRRAGGKLVLHSLPAQARHVLQLLQLEHTLPSAPDAASGRTLLQERKVGPPTPSSFPT